MDNYCSVSHTKWECLNHCVWIPNDRKKTLFLELRQSLRTVVHDVAR